MSYETLLCTSNDHIVEIVFNRPDKMNAFSAQMFHELRDALAAARDNRDARVVILGGAGNNFSAGLDLAEAMSMTDDPTKALFELLYEFDKPLLAAVDGVGVGFGLTSLLYCDFVYVTSRARLRAPFVGLGLVPEAASSVLFPLVIGYRNSMEVVLGADFINGERAVELGIANEVVEPDQVLDRARKQASHLAQHAPQAMQYSKRLLIESRRDALSAGHAREQQAFGELMGKPENIEAFMAFAEKREPDFSRLDE